MFEDEDVEFFLWPPGLASLTWKLWSRSVKLFSSCLISIADSRLRKVPRACCNSSRCEIPDGGPEGEKEVQEENRDRGWSAKSLNSGGGGGIFMVSVV